MTFVLVSVVYAVAVGEPSFGIMGPFAVGLALFAMVFAGELIVYHISDQCTLPLRPQIWRHIATTLHAKMQTLVTSLGSVQAEQVLLT